MITVARSRPGAALPVASGSPCSWAPFGTSAAFWRTPPTSPRASFAGPPANSAGEERWEHQAEIRTAYGYRPFGDGDGDGDGVEDELVLWLRARAWVSAESHRVLFARAAEHLIARRILLRGYSTLWRLVGAAREHADARGYRMLAETPTAEQRERLQALLHTPTGRRLSALERAAPPRGRADDRRSHRRPRACTRTACARRRPRWP